MSGLDLPGLRAIAEAALANERRNWFETTGTWEVDPKDDEQVIVRGTFKNGDKLIPDCIRAVTDGSISTDAAHIATFDPPTCIDLLDKIDGLKEDLRSAVEVAFERGATTWVRLNYPKDFERLAALKDTPNG